MSVEEVILARGITEILHFTTNRGVLGALSCGDLCSRPLLSSNAYLRHVLKMNASIRPEESFYFDKSQDWLRFVNLSISEINRRFLDVSRKWHHDDDLWWCILAFDASIICHDNVWFATTNNGYDSCLRSTGVEGLQKLFDPSIDRKTAASGGPWRVTRGARPDNLPTCEQAEVLYPEKLGVEFLERVYVQENEHHDIMKGWLYEAGREGVEVIVGNEKFIGRRN